MVPICVKHHTYWSASQTSVQSWKVAGIWESTIVGDSGMFSHPQSYLGSSKFDGRAWLNTWEGALGGGLKTMFLKSR